jgi:hypothetical protein
MSFTFYADLLGISNSYKLSPQTAHDKLNDFYNITFDTFNGYLNVRQDARAFLFSDSFLICGQHSTYGLLEQLHLLYVRLIKKGLLLRGAIVNGSLEFEPRFELSNLEKSLPVDDTLARAVGLEKTKKGSRLIMENAIVDELFGQLNCTEWKSVEGYILNPHLGIPHDGILRRICPNPNLDSYEYLYPWVPSKIEFNQEIFDIEQVKMQLRETSSMLEEEIAVHYRETIKLFDRAMQRKKFTEQYVL